MLPNYFNAAQSTSAGTTRAATPAPALHLKKYYAELNKDFIVSKRMILTFGNSISCKILKYLSCVTR